MNKPHKYTEEDIIFIRNNIDTMSYNEMAQYFSEKYNMQFRGDSISKVAKRNGISKQIRIYKDRENNRYRNFYSEEMFDFLRINFASCHKWDELTDLFNEKFEKNYSTYEIRGICRRKFGLEMANSTKFSKRTHPKRLPIGTERIGTGGHLCVKVSDDDLPPGNSSNWKPKSRVVYEGVYGEIPKDHMIIQLDGDSNNFDIENLYCVNRKIMGYLAHNGWWNLSKELKITAIKLCELNIKLNESRG